MASAPPGPKISSEWLGGLFRAAQDIGSTRHAAAVEDIRNKMQIACATMWSRREQLFVSDEPLLVKDPFASLEQLTRLAPGEVMDESVRQMAIQLSGLMLAWGGHALELSRGGWDQDGGDTRATNDSRRALVNAIKTVPASLSMRANATSGLVASVGVAAQLFGAGATYADIAALTTRCSPFRGRPALHVMLTHTPLSSDTVSLVDRLNERAATAVRRLREMATPKSGVAATHTEGVEWAHSNVSLTLRVGKHPACTTFGVTFTDPPMLMVAHANTTPEIVTGETSVGWEWWLATLLDVAQSRGARREATIIQSRVVLPVALNQTTDTVLGSVGGAQLKHAATTMFSFVADVDAVRDASGDVHAFAKGTVEQRLQHALRIDGTLLSEVDGVTLELSRFKDVERLTTVGDVLSSEWCALVGHYVCTDPQFMTIATACLCSSAFERSSAHILNPREETIRLASLLRIDTFAAQLYWPYGRDESLWSRTEKFVRVALGEEFVAAAISIDPLSLGLTIDIRRLVDPDARRSRGDNPGMYIVELSKVRTLQELIQALVPARQALLSLLLLDTGTAPTSVEGPSGP